MHRNTGGTADPVKVDEQDGVRLDLPPRQVGVGLPVVLVERLGQQRPHDVQLGVVVDHAADLGRQLDVGDDLPGGAGRLRGPEAQQLLGHRYAFGPAYWRRDAVLPEGALRRARNKIGSLLPKMTGTHQRGACARPSEQLLPPLGPWHRASRRDELGVPATQHAKEDVASTSYTAYPDCGSGRLGVLGSIPLPLASPLSLPKAALWEGHDEGYAQKRVQGVSTWRGCRGAYVPC